MVWRCFFPPQKARCSVDIDAEFATTIEDLNNEVLEKVFRFLPNEDVLSVSQTCSRFRNLTAKQKTKENELISVKNKELVYRYNCRLDKVEIHVLKIGRSISGVTRKSDNNNIRSFNLVAENLEELLVDGIVFRGAIIFENNVDVASAVDEILEFHSRGQLLPKTLRFHGGKAEFLKFIRSLRPNLQQVHLMTSRHFKLSRNSRYLLQLCDQLTHFSLMYEKPAIRFSLQDLVDTASYWRLHPPLNSCEFSIRHPLIDEEQLVPLEKAEPFNIEVDENDEITLLQFSHPEHPSIKLTFRFH
ncbi:hypothetical protein FO519_008849 [Halicephalobus sp. NKZ332]|nr:hypothetical protein FO519_008849 [Halicephalobus sp. NKZ332]